jgi:RimJ/RimL family protein N-acetyltransferase
MWADADTMRHISGVASTPEESWHRVVRNIGHWAAYGYGFWTLHEREGGAFAGICGFKQFRRDLDPSLQSLPEIGWIMAPAARGRGLATEAAQAALAWTDRMWPAAMTVCMVDPANMASLQVAARCGYHSHAQAQYGGKPVIILTRRG